MVFMKRIKKSRIEIVRNTINKFLKKIVFVSWNIKNVAVVIAVIGNKYAHQER